MGLRCWLLVVVGLFGVVAAQAAETSSAGGGLNWLTDYATAYRRAQEQRRWLLIYFRNGTPTAAEREFENTTLQDPQVIQQLAAYERVQLSVEGPVQLDGQPVDLLDHPAFVHMNGREGLAIVDLRHPGRSYYQRPVSCLPFQQPVYYAAPYASPQSVRVLLDLPPGTITQRTMVYAVRMHPERPASTAGAADAVLLDECRQHCSHQARLRRQGHHRWERRFPRIWRTLGGKPPVEVCAESWPGKGLLAACIDCVHSWRQSSGHWNAVRSGHPAYGYDIQRGSNGIWYATGIFGG